MHAISAIFALLLGPNALAHYHHHRNWRPVHHAHGDRGADLYARQVSLGEQTVTITDNSRTDTTIIPEIVVFTDGSGSPVSTATAVVALVPPAETLLAEDLVPRGVVDAEVELGAPEFVDEAAEAGLAGASSLNTRDDDLVDRAASSGLFGVAYAPYNADGSCKTANQVMQDFTLVAQSYGMVRVYGVDCNQIPPVYAAAKKNKLRVMYGIYGLDNLGDQIATLTQGIASDWSNVDTVSIGNELVNNGQASPKQVLDALASAKQMLSAAGYTGPVVTVDTFVAALAHPELCSASDYCAVNIHPFFDPNTEAKSAGTFVLNMVQALRTKLGDPSARVRVTESGWPWQGSANSKAVPGVDEQAAAFKSIKTAFASNPQDMVLFSAFNDRWKTAAEPTFYAEQFWGIGTADAPSA